MKNEALEKPFPENLFDDICAPCPSELPEDFLPTLMYILRCVASPRDTKIVLKRYKDGDTFEEIGNAFGISKQRAHITTQDIISQFTYPYIEMLTKGIKKYYEDLLTNRIKELSPVIEKSEREEIKMSSFDEGYNKGYADGLAGRKSNATNQSVLNEVEITTLQLSNRTFNALSRNRIITLGGVVDVGDKLLDFTSFGRMCFYEIANILKDYGVNIESTFPKCVKKWGEE